jgi:hypothetical protein
MVEGKSFESVLSDRLSMFRRYQSTQQPTVSSVGVTSSHGKNMIRGGPPLQNSHSKRRLLSSNERMITNLIKKRCCSLCLYHKHQVNVCPLLETHQASLVPWRNVKEFAERIGNPLYYEVQEPSEETRHQLPNLVFSGHPQEIPADACHLVLHQTFLCPLPDQPISCNSIQVTILGKGGVMLPKYEKTYLSVYKISNWIVKNCAVIRRKHHVLSTLQSRTVDRN